MFWKSRQNGEEDGGEAKPAWGFYDGSLAGLSLLRYRAEEPLE